MEKVRPRASAPTSRGAGLILAAAFAALVAIAGIAHTPSAFAQSTPQISATAETSKDTGENPDPAATEDACALVEKALSCFADHVDLSTCNLDLKSTQALVNRAYLEPRFFYLDTIEIVSSDGQAKYLVLKYVADKASLQALVDKYDDAIEKAVAQMDVEECASDASKALAVHDHLVETCTYHDVSAGQEPLAYTAYGALVDGKAVCDGYAFACIALLEHLGVACEYVPSEEMNHSWVLVNIGDRWYHMDCTWDDNETERKNAGIVHKAFLRGDASMKTLGYHGWVASHKADMDYGDAQEAGTCLQ